MNKNASLITNIESRITYNEKGSLVHKASTIVDPGIYIKEKKRISLLRTVAEGCCEEREMDG